jgi:hypothetical protein
MTDRTLTIFRCLAIKREVTLGGLAGSHADEFRAALAAAASRFEMGVAYSEKDVNDRLRHFLANAGAMLATDHVELRRWLVDNRLIGRDGFGHRYERSAAPASFAPLVAAFEGFDLDRFASEARSADAEARRVRRERFRDRAAAR